AEQAHRAFDLAAGPLLQVGLVRAGHDDHALCVTMHHIVSDGWSMAIFAREFAVVYEACVRGEPAPLLPLSVQYSDFARWQRSWLQGEALELRMGFWRERLAGMSAELALPTDRPRPAVTDHRGRSLPVRLDAELSARIATLCLEEGVTPFMVLLAALQCLLSRHSNQLDIAVGAPVANRDRREIEDLIGFFVNVLVLRTDLAGDPRFGQLLRRVREVALDAFAHQEVPFEKLVDELRPERSLSASPLVQVMLVLQNAPFEDLRLPGVEVAPLAIEATTAKLDLTLSLHRDGETWSGWLEHSAELFDAATMRRFAGHLEVLLAGAAAQPQIPISSLPLLRPEERQQVLVEHNATGVRRGPQARLEDLVAAQAARTPDAVAVVRGAAAVSYRELERRALRLAGSLRRLGVGPEVRVGLLADRTPDLVVGLLGILQAGGAYVPLDPAYPPERLAWIVADAGVELAVATGDPGRRLPDSVRTVRPEAAAEATEETARRDEPDERGGWGQLAYVIYTSGSTGRPKGVSIEHRSAVELVRWALEEYSAAELAGVLAATSICFDLSVFELFVPLSCGGCVVLAEDALSLGSVTAQVTLLNTVPSAMAELVRGELPAGLRTVNLAGEPLRADLVERICRHDQVRRVVNLYGPSEDTTYSTYAVVPAGVERVPIGRPVSNTQAYVVDGRGGLSPLGVAGELYLGGHGLARGYLGRAELTAERFVPDPFGASGGRLYRTGDLVRRRADGELEFLGRLDHQVKVRGYRIELGEVESELVSHPGVESAVVEVRTVGEDRRLVAYVVGEGWSEADLRSHLERRLPAYMVPWALVRLGELPLLPNGKVDRKALPAPEPRSAAGGGAPRTPLEEMLAGIWSELLGLDRVGTTDSFFDLGGHSLLATRVVARVREALGVDLPVRALFEAPTLDALAQRIERERSGMQGSEPPLVPVPHVGGAPLSFAQERLWFLDQLEPGAASYNSVVAVRLRGHLDTAALRAAIAGLVHRHEALRTTFSDLGGVLVQKVEPGSEPPLPLLDLSACGLPESGRLVARMAGEEVRRPFDLAVGPLLRTILLRLEPRQHVLVLAMHHIVSDGWSLGVLVSDLAALYRAAAVAAPSPLPALPVQYADFSIWQRSWLTGKVLARQVAYWKRRLEGAPVLELPADRPRPVRRTLRGAAVAVEMPTELSTALARFARTLGATLFMALLAAYAALLSRLSGQRDLPIGFPIANRSRRELEGLIGFFANTLVLRIDLTGDPTGGELLQRVREIALEAYDHQDVPFEKLVEELQPPRSLGTTPLFQALLAVQNAPMAPFALPDLVLEPVDVDVATANFDLALSVGDTERGLCGILRYSGDLFDGTTVRRWLAHLGVLARELAGRPDRRLGELPLLGEPERYQLLVGWNDSRDGGPPAPSYLSRVELWALRTPDAPAVVCEGRTLSYAELSGQARALAGQLCELGVGPEVVVGLCLDRSIDAVVGILGIHLAGGAYLPLDPMLPGPRLAFMLDDARAPVVIVRPGILEARPELAAGGRTVFPWRRGWQPAPCAGPAGGGEPGSLAYVIYTSGSTGRPKGVGVEHSQLMSYLSAVLGRLGLYGPASFATVSTLAADLGHTAIFGALASGGCLHMVAEERIADAEALAEAFAAHPVDCLKIVPSHLRALLHTSRRPEKILPRRRLILGGEASDGPMIRALRTLAPGCAVFNHYGPTETTVGVAACRAPDQDRIRSTATLPLGHPLAGAEIHVLDETLQPVPIGVPGEIWIGGRSVARGYLGHPDLTAGRFVPDPFGGVPGGRLYRTGDLGRRLPDGAVEFLGRIDFQVKIRGFRVETAEVASALGRLAEIREAAVVARPGPDGEPQLVAYVVPAAGAAAGAGLKEGWRAALRAELPAYMIPSAFQRLDRLPRTANGKLDMGALPEPVAEPAEEGEAEAPRGEIEAALAAIWCELLSREWVGRAQDFFALGGHSLLATQMVSRVRQAFGIELPLRAAFEASALSALAERVALALAHRGGEAPPIVPVPRDRELPLSFAQERLWLLHQVEPESPLFNIPLRIVLRGRLDIDALQRSLDAIVDRHEILRTTFPESLGRARQTAAVGLRLGLPVIDLADLSAADRVRTARSLSAAEARRPFDLVRGPLFRTLLVRLAPGEHAALLTLHHIISDGWSRGVLIRELAALYEAFTRRGASPLPDLPIQYADYAVWQRMWLADGGEERHLTYWRPQLAGLPALELPTDRPRPAAARHSGRNVTFTLRHALVDALRSGSPGLTPFMVLLTVFEVLLGCLSGQEDFAVGADVANRERLETEGLIGFFVNQLVLRADLSGDPTFAELLARARGVTVGAFAHQDMPFQRLVRRLELPREGGRQPLFQVKLVFQNAPLPTLSLEGLELVPMDVEIEVTQLDLILFAQPWKDEIRCSLHYDTDLFEAGTAARMAWELEQLLAAAAADPEVRFSGLRAHLARVRRERETAEEERIATMSFNKFKSIKPKPVKLSEEPLVEMEPLRPGERLPLLVRPAAPDVDLASWAAHHRGLIEEKLALHGCLLFRGFEINTPPRFESFAGALCHELFNENGEHPRTSITGNVYTPVFFPSDQHLLWHNENSFNHSWPMKIFFACARPADRGGETTIVDSREVFDRVDPAVREKFMRRGITYVRNYGQGLGLDWRSVFQTDDRAVVEDRCRANGMHFEWKAGDRLRTESTRPAVVRHPRTGELSWFNQAQHWHISCLDPATRESITALFAEEDLPRSCYYGEGSPIEDSVMQDVLGIYREQEVCFPWQEGDVMMLDNVLTAHGRNSFQGERKILVVLGDMTSFDDVRM
ncbi:MAG TPA: amino acid adenylation domain-containing protein, partial [Thermoanaerobaculia bacterium]|nr:amino acid adenylation domain-containing protein [Thermoanaerobaculia bacterium]